jgi:hypothetical protein
LTSIELSWQSNTEATGIIFYADETDHEILLTSPQQQGIVLISDLELGGFYDFELWLNDVYGQRAVTHVTKQLPTTATMMSSPQVWSNQAGLHISWQTNELATGSVRHSLSGGTLQTTPSLGTSTEHSVLITGYTPGQTVQYQISGQGATQYESMVFTYVVPNPPGLYVLPEEPDPVPILRPMRELRRPR